MIRSLFTAAILSITLLSSFQAAAQQSMQEPNWSRALARSEAGRVDSRETLKHLYRLARNGSEEQLILELERIRKNGNWPVPARENLLHAFATGLGDMEAWTVSAVVIGYLQDYQPQVIVPHDDNANAGVPLYNIRAAATGAANQWRRQAAVAQAERMLKQDEYAWLQAWLDAAPPQRKAYEDALGSAGNRQIAELGRISLQLADEHPALATVAARAGLLLSDPEMFQLALENGRGPGLAQALRAAADEFSDNDKLELLQVSILRAPPGNAALAIALLTPAMLDHPDAAELMFRTLENRELGSSAALVLSKSKDPVIQKRLAVTASAKGSLASQRAALAIGQLQASEGEQP